MYDDCMVDELVNFDYGIPTQKEAIRRSRLVLKAANELGIDTRQWCLKFTRCGYFHCNVCRRSQQLALLRGMQESEAQRLKNQKREKVWRSITIVPEYGRCELRSLPEGGIVHFGSQVVKTLQAHAPRIQGVFVIEPSVNIDLQRANSCQWHVHGIFNRVKRVEYEAIQKAFTWESPVQSLDLLQRFTPVYTRRVTDLYGQLVYMAKPQILSRRAIGTKIRNTAKGVPSTRQEALIAAALYPEKIGSRMMFLNMKSVRGYVEKAMG